MTTSRNQSPPTDDPTRRLIGRDLTDPRWMFVKAAGFLVIALSCVTLILLETPRWDIAAYLFLAIWSFARAYYFAFYVIEHYVDPSYRFDGLFSAFRHFFKNRKDTNRYGPG